MGVSIADRALFQRWLDHRDAHAFTEIVERHSGMVYGVCRRILGNASDAEDVAQDCFVELAHTSRRVRHSLAGWLHALAAARSLDRIRSEQRRRARESRFAAESPAASEASKDDVWAEVDEAIASLPEKLREPIVCRFLEGQSQVVVAERLGTSRATVQRRLDQGIGRIRGFLRRRGVAASAVGLVAIFEAYTAEAAPAAVTAGLGKLALSGGAGAASATTVSAAGATGLKALTSGGGIGMATKAMIGIAAGLMALTALWARVDATKEETDRGVASASEHAASRPETTGALPSADVSGAVATPVKADQRFDVAEATAMAESSAPVEVPASASQNAVLRGGVVDSRGLPVGNARLGYRREEDGATGSTETDAAGGFEANELEPGRYALTQVSFAADHTSGLWYGFLVEPPPVVEVGAGESVEDVVVKLNEPIGQAVVLIRVVNTQGEPVPRAAIAMTIGQATTSGPSTDEEGRYKRYHAPDWESEVSVEVSHRDYETQEFLVPVGEEEVELVMQSKESGALQLTVVDGKTGRPLPEAEVGKDGKWQLAKDGTVLFAELSATDHRIEARAPGYVGGWRRFSVPPGETVAESLTLFEPASVRMSFQTEGHMAMLLGPVENLSENSGLHLNAYGRDRREGPLARAEWQEDNTVVLPVSADHPSDIELSAYVKTHPEDRSDTHTFVTVSGLVVDEGEEARVRVTAGGGTCVLKAPKIQGLSYYLSLFRDGDRPGVEVENAAYEGVSERRIIPANPATGMYVAGELYPGTYRLRYSLRTDDGTVSEEQFITFTREHEEIVLEWE